MKTNRRGVTNRVKLHVLFSGNRKRIVATREAISAMKYKAQ